MILTISVFTTLALLRVISSLADGGERAIPWRLWVPLRAGGRRLAAPSNSGAEGPSARAGLAESVNLFEALSYWF